MAPPGINIRQSTTARLRVMPPPILGSRQPIPNWSCARSGLLTAARPALRSETAPPAGGGSPGCIPMHPCGLTPLFEHVQDRSGPPDWRRANARRCTASLWNFPEHAPPGTFQAAPRQRAPLAVSLPLPHAYWACALDSHFPVNHPHPRMLSRPNCRRLLPNLSSTFPTITSNPIQSPRSLYLVPSHCY